MEQPLVSCIMPTANRKLFIPYALDYFLHQDYKNSELIILDDGIEPVHSLIPIHPRIKYYFSRTPSALGTKRNICCQNAKGEIIIHWDDDDWYAPDWITKQVNALINSGADITGINNINYFSTQLNKIWKYRDHESSKPWVYGGTLAYWKSFWKKHPFKEMNSGEDNNFISKPETTIYIHDYTDGYIGIIHTTNIGIKLYEDPREKLQLVKWFKQIEEPRVAEQSNLNLPLSNLPLVTCIMPTANRQVFIPSAIRYFLKQDYPNKELVVIDDGKKSISDLIPNEPNIRYFYFEPLGKIGTKRNIACEKAKGELIMHFDDDDWYAEDWISCQVDALINSGADIAGINQVQFFSPSQDSYWMTKNSNSKRPWLTGASLIYRKSFWEQHPFKDLQIGEDDDYVRNTGAKVFAHDYYQGFMATLHPNNTSIKFFEDPNSKITN